MAQNENGEETQKSEHARTSVFTSSTTLLSLSEADGGRCGQQVVQKVLGRRDGTLYLALISANGVRHAPSRPSAPPSTPIAILSRIASSERHFKRDTLDNSSALDVQTPPGRHRHERRRDE